MLTRHSADRGWARTQPLLVTLAYIALILGYTWPLPLRAADHLVLIYGVDLWQNLWNFGWVRTALVDLHQSPYYTYSVFYPTGAPLAYHALNVFSAAVSIPAQLVFGLIPAFNLLLWANLVAAALATYWLARGLGLPAGPAFLAGLVFACGPTINSAVNQGQGEQISVFWLPLYAGMLLRGAGLRALERPPGRRGYLVGAGLVLAGSVLAIYYWFMNLLVFTAVYALLEVWGACRAGGARAVPGVLGRLALVGGVAVIALSPLLALLVAAQMRGGALVLTGSAGQDLLTISGSQDLLAFLLPAPAHVDPRAPVTGWGPQGIHYGLGWTVLVLAIAGGALARRRVALWIAAAAVLAVLALGPTLVVAGQVTGIPLPYAALLELPGAAAMRAPERFLVFLTLCTALLAAYGFAGLGSRIRSRGWRIAGTTLLAACCLVEFFGVPRTLVAPAVAPFFARLARDPSPCLGRLPAPPSGCGAVLELPADAWNVEAMFHEALDGHPVLGGYLSRHPEYWFTVDTPGVSQLVRADPGDLRGDILTPAPRDVALQALDYYGVRYVVVHPLTGDGNAGGLQTTLRMIFPLPGSPDGDLTVYTVPGVPQTRAFLFLGAGWYAQELDATGAGQRWTAQQALVRVVVPPAAAGVYRLGLETYAAGRPRTLLATLDGQEIARRPVPLPPGTTISLPLDLRPGEHLLGLASVEPALPPPGDRRLLGLGYHAVRLERSP